MAGESRDLGRAVAADLMGPAESVSPADALRRVAAVLARSGARQVPFVEDGRVVGFVGVDDVARALLARAGEESPPGPVGS